MEHGWPIGSLYLSRRRKVRAGAMVVEAGGGVRGVGPALLCRNAEGWLVSEGRLFLLSPVYGLTSTLGK